MIRTELLGIKEAVMRNVYKFLRASILILILVGGTYFIAQEYSAGIENAVNTSAGGQSLTKETITNLGDSDGRSRDRRRSRK